MSATPQGGLFAAIPARRNGGHFWWAAFAAIALIFCASAPRASAVLVTYFNFDDSNETSDLPGIQTSTITQNALSPSFVAGSTLNIAPGDPSPGPNRALRLTNTNNGNGNPKTFQFSVSTLGLANLSLSYATQASVANYTQTLFYSTNSGATFTQVGTFIPTTTGFTLASFDLSGITAVNDQASVIFRIGLTQNGGLKDDYNYFDNIQLNATPVPEPATVAGGVLALAGLGFAQRRRLRRHFVRLVDSRLWRPNHSSG